MDRSRAQTDHPLMHGDAVGGAASERGLRLIHLKAYADAAARANGRAVLDVGCSDGYGTMILAERARRVTGIDVSPEAIQAARSRPVVPGVVFQAVDGGRLPFPDGEFDLITLFQVIEHVQETRPFLEDVRRVLAPGGTALFTTPNAAIRLDPGMTPWNPFHVREYTAPELRAELTPVFDNVEVRGLLAPAPIADAERSRCMAARRRARHPRPWPIRTVIRLLPAGLRGRLRALRAHETGAPAVLDGFGVDDLWYVDHDFDTVLDLHASGMGRALS